MFEEYNDESDSILGIDGSDAVALVGKVAKWALIIAIIAICFVAPALVVYCRWGADADADGSVSREEYDANVTAILGTGVLSYLKPVMAFWEKIVFIVLPVAEAA